MKQSTALDILKTGQNVFLTGSAGSGKTYTLNQYIHYLRARRVPVAVTASTGIAATHMNGVTIHSWSGIGIKDTLNDKDLANMMRKQFLRDRIQDTAVLIIDEISMLHGKQLDLVNQVLKTIRKDDDGFGGIQLVVAGDFFQLPPIGNKEETNREKFAFMSQAWLDADFHICYLTEQHRQQTAPTTTPSSSPNSTTTANDQSPHNQDTPNQSNASLEANNQSSYDPANALNLDDILNQIRAGQVTYAAIDTLNATAFNDVDINRTRLYTHNLNVNRINQKELDALDSEEETFTYQSFGDSKLVDTLKKSVRTADELVLKVGAKVMFVKNNNELGVSNGTMGEVVGFEPISKSDPEGSKRPVVKLNHGRRVLADYDEWSIESETGEILASFSQVPLTLAWAITIHKSQGMTLEAAEIDLSKTFELGQGYVALSRLKSLEGLQLMGMNDMSLQLDPLARGADRRFMALSDEAIEAYAMLDEDSLSKAHDAFVLTSGGTLSQEAIAAYEKLQQRRREKQQQNQEKKQKLAGQLNDKSSATLMETKILLEESLSIAEISEQRGLAQSTIMRHIADIKQQDPSVACDHLRPDDSIMTAVGNAYVAVKVANDPNDFNDDGSIKLKPIFEHLREQIDYNTIRLALIFL